MSLKATLSAALKDLKYVFLFSLFTNILMLASTWYMLEVYDRVLPSQNHTTLLMLTIFILGLYFILESLEWIRGSLMLQASISFEESLKHRVFQLIFQTKLKQLANSSSQPLSDLKTIQETIGSPAFLVLIDIPFMIMTLIVLFWIHISLGFYALISAIILGVVAFFNQKMVAPPLKEANQHQIVAQSYINETIKQSEVIRALGMLKGVRIKWLERQDYLLNAQVLASNRANVNMTTSKFIQYLQSSLLLGLSCWLILRGDPDMQSSVMIVASTLGGRALAPLVALISQWKTLSNGVEAYLRLDKLLTAFPVSKKPMALPAPQGDLMVENLFGQAPQSNITILKGVNFRLAPGQILAIIGPSGSGKTTLTKFISGIWSPSQGKVRLDGVDVSSWSKDELGPHLGYLPQSFDLFEGTIAENIARLGEVDIEKVQEVADIVGLKPFIENLEDGLNTNIGNAGSYLSGGQRQRIALARALYNNPKIIILDEPSSNLDREGDHALIKALSILKSKGSSIILIAHQTHLIELADQVLVLIDGQNKMYGPKDEVIAALQGKPSSSNK